MIRRHLADFLGRTGTAFLNAAMPPVPPHVPRCDEEEADPIPNTVPTIPAQPKPADRILAVGIAAAERAKDRRGMADELLWFHELDDVHQAADEAHGDARGGRAGLVMASQSPSSSSSRASGSPSPRMSSAYSKASRRAPISLSLLDPRAASWASCASARTVVVCSAVTVTALVVMGRILGGSA